MVRHVTSADCDAIARIYNYYIANTVITFEEQLLKPEDILARIRNVEAAALPWLVVEEGGRVVGYAYASKWKERAAYRHSVEISVYLDPDHRGKGLGTSLYEGLFAILRSKGVHVAIAGIALPNEASVALAEKFGMEKVAHFREVGFKLGRWIDVGYWQCIL